MPDGDLRDQNAFLVRQFIEKLLNDLSAQQANNIKISEQILNIINKLVEIAGQAPTNSDIVKMIEEEGRCFEEKLRTTVTLHDTGCGDRLDKRIDRHHAESTQNVKVVMDTLQQLILSSTTSVTKELAEARSDISDMSTTTATSATTLASTLKEFTTAVKDLKDMGWRIQIFFASTWIVGGACFAWLAWTISKISK